MAIQPNDLVIFQSERLTDNDDGGGQYNGVAVPDGTSNNLFDDISQTDRTTGRVSIRKIYPSVISSDTSKLLGATVFISQVPKDQNVAAFLTTTKSWTDERLAAVDQLENYLAKGGEAVGRLYGTAYAGMKQIQVIMFPGEVPNVSGDTLILIKNEDAVNEVQQYVRITGVTQTIGYVMIDNTKVEYLLVTYTINSALESDFQGVTAAKWYSNTIPNTVLRSTIVADTGSYYSSVVLEEDVAIGDTVIKAKSMFARLVPAAQTETVLSDLSVSGTATALIGVGTSAISRTLTCTVGANNSTYIGTPIAPGTLTFNIGSTACYDQGGELYTNAGVSVGTIEYDKGLIKWSSNSGSGSKSITFAFIPAAARSRVTNTDFVTVTAATRSLNWVKTLDPAPAPNGFTFVFTSQGKNYYLYDDGSGKISGVVSGIGVGTVDYSTGTVVITLSALPDADTEIIYYWADAITTTDIVSRQETKLRLQYDLSTKYKSDGTFTWSYGGTNYTATVDSSGNISGDATGSVLAKSVKFYPNNLILPSTTVNFAYTPSAGDTKTATITCSKNGSGIVINGVTYPYYAMTLPTNIEQGSLRLSASFMTDDYYLATTSDTQYSKVKRYAYYRDFNGEIWLISNSNALTSLASTDANDLVKGNASGVTKIVKVGVIDYTTGVIQIAGYGGYGTVYTSEVIEKKGYTGYVYATVTKYTAQSLLFSSNATTLDFAYGYEEQQAATSIDASLNTNAYVIEVKKSEDKVVATESVSFKVSSNRYYIGANTLYTSLDATTGVGTSAGTYDESSALINISSLTAGVTNAITWESIAETVDTTPVSSAVFKTPTFPIRSGSFQLLIGTDINVTAGTDGTIIHEKVIGTVDYETGTVKLAFVGKQTSVTAAQLATMKQQYPWLTTDYYSLNSDGVTYTVNITSWYSPDDIRYNAVAYSYIPISADVLGIDPTRLPSDGRVPIFRVGDIAVISSSKTQQLTGYVAGETYNLDHQRISYCELVDENGTAVNTSLYTVDYDYGRVTLGGDFALNSLVAPLSAKYRYQDMSLIGDVQINGTLTFTKPVTHSYSAADTIVGSVLQIGDMQARYANLFMQQTWSNIWADTSTGTSISAKYNDSIYPLVMTNKGSIQERWAIVFTSATSFNCVGEYSGTVGSGTINSDFAPNNPVTNEPYFIMKAAGWGAGWATGNAVRFNTIAANYPIWVIRTVQQSEYTTLSDEFQIMLHGDIDRVI
ncbi:hypothetical protein ACX1NX_02845 [Acinetobacter sp. ANC 5383]